MLLKKSTLLCVPFESLITFMHFAAIKINHCGNGREAELASALSSAPCLPAGVRSPPGANFPVGSAGVKKSSRLSSCPKHSLGLA